MVEAAVVVVELLLRQRRLQQQKKTSRPLQPLQLSWLHPSHLPVAQQVGQCHQRPLERRGKKVMERNMNVVSYTHMHTKHK